MGELDTAKFVIGESINISIIACQWFGIKLGKEGRVGKQRRIIIISAIGWVGLSCLTEW